MLKITSKLLVNHNPCDGGLIRFEALFPDGAKLTLKDYKKARADDYDLLSWFIDHFLTNENHILYQQERWNISGFTFEKREEQRAKLYVKYVKKQMEENQNA